MITIKEIAAQLDMSPTTVSNVIHGKTREVSKDTIERVNRFLEQVDYIPNINARNLAQNQSKIIGVVLKTEESRHTYANILADPFVSEMLGGIESRVSDSGYFVMLYISDDINKIIHQVSTWNVDGLVLFWMMDDDALKVSRKFHKPIVSIDTYLGDEAAAKMGEFFVNIGLEDEKGVYEGVSYLISRGHKKIGFLTDSDMGVDKERYKGYLKALEDGGIEYSEDNYFHLKTTTDEIEGSLLELAEKCRGFDAVFCCSDIFGLMLMSACARKGIRVPEDVSILGFDDNLNSRLSYPALTTIHQDISKKGELAADTLLSMVKGKKPESQQIILGTSIVERESVSDLTKN
ncbi:MAG: LacI family DNA-binding transcriptional regulator [Lachnospiraceae bacterium]|nr:LacI family DNA-binding transcriptional regulator [Lachnospiraceae bacterium]